MGNIDAALSHIELPRMMRVRQHFPENCLADPAEKLIQELSRPDVEILSPLGDFAFDERGNLF